MSFMGNKICNNDHIKKNKNKNKKNKNHLFWQTCMQLQQHPQNIQLITAKSIQKAKPPKLHTCLPDRRTPKDSPEALHWKGPLIRFFAF